MPERSGGRSRAATSVAVWALLPLVAFLWVHARSVSVGLFADDHDVLAAARAPSRGLADPYPAGGGAYRRPLTLASFAWTERWAKGESSAEASGATNLVLAARRHHATNLLLHAVSTGLLAIVLRLAGGGPRVVAAGATIFAAHPTTIEPVYWISGRGDLLCAVFVLAAVIAFQRIQVGARWPWVVAVPLCGLLAAASKETGIVLPAVLVGWAVASGRPWRGRATWAIAASALVAGAFAASSWRASDATLDAALLGMPRVALIGANALALRVPAYSLRRLAQAEPALVAVALVVGVCGALAVAVVLWRRGRRTALLRITSLMLAAGAPLALLAPFGWAADRHAYLPLAVLLAGVPMLGAEAPRSGGGRRIDRALVGCWALAVVVAIALGTARAGVWVENARLLESWCASFRELDPWEPGTPAPRAYHAGEGTPDGEDVEIDRSRQSLQARLVVVGFPSLRGGAPLYSNDLSRSVADCRADLSGETTRVVGLGALEVPARIADPTAAVEVSVAAPAFSATSETASALPGSPPMASRTIEVRATAGHFGRAPGPVGHLFELAEGSRDPAGRVVVSSVDSAGDWTAFRLELAAAPDLVVLSTARGGFRVVR